MGLYRRRSEFRESAANFVSGAKKANLCFAGLSASINFRYDTDLRFRINDENTSQMFGREERLKWARCVCLERVHRAKFIDDSFFGEPCWDILLELYIALLENRKVATKAACIASGVPFATAMRKLHDLEIAGLIQRTCNGFDKRIKWVSLTEKARLGLDRICESDLRLIATLR